MLFTDDFQIYLQSKKADLPLIIIELNDDIQHVVDWAKDRYLTLNWSKIVAIIFSTNQMLQRIYCNSLPNILINGRHVRLVESTRNLDVILTKNPSWKNSR